MSTSYVSRSGANTYWDGDKLVLHIPNNKLGTVKVIVQNENYYSTKINSFYSKKFTKQEEINFLIILENELQQSTVKLLDYLLQIAASLDAIKGGSVVAQSLASVGVTVASYTSTVPIVAAIILAVSAVGVIWDFIDKNKANREINKYREQAAQIHNLLQYFNSLKAQIDERQKEQQQNTLNAAIPVFAGLFLAKLTQ